MPRDCLAFLKQMRAHKGAAILKTDLVFPAIPAFGFNDNEIGGTFIQAEQLPQNIGWDRRDRLQTVS
jgi:hypothetical protein